MKSTTLSKQRWKLRSRLLLEENCCYIRIEQRSQCRATQRISSPTIEPYCIFLNLTTISKTKQNLIVSSDKSKQQFDDVIVRSQLNTTTKQIIIIIIYKKNTHKSIQFKFLRHPIRRRTNSCPIEANRRRQSNLWIFSSSPPPKYRTIQYNRSCLIYRRERLAIAHNFASTSSPIPREKKRDYTFSASHRNDITTLSNATMLVGVRVSQSASYSASSPLVVANFFKVLTHP